MEKLNNLLSFKEYSELKQFDKSTKRTEIGGDVVSEKKKCDGCKKSPCECEKDEKCDCDKPEGKCTCKKDEGKKKLTKAENQERFKEMIAAKKGDKKEDGEKGKEDKKLKHVKEFNQFEKETLEEGWFSKDKITKEEALDRLINPGNPKFHIAKAKVYKNLPEDQKGLYVDFFMNNPDFTYAKWDGAKFVDAGRYSTPNATEII